ncbi:MAG: hypothetical protein AAB969_03245 [Patescibacteria group bacterium]
MIKKEDGLKEKERMGEAINIAAKGEVVARFIEKYPDKAKDRIMPLLERSIGNADNNNIWVSSEGDKGTISPGWKEAWLKEEIESAYKEIKDILTMDEFFELEEGE